MGVFAFVVVTEWLDKAEHVRLPGVIIALLALAAGGAVSFLHIGHPERVANVLSNLQSRISQELILIVLAALLIGLYGLALLTGFLPPIARKILATIGLICAVLLAAWGGWMYYLPARPAWYTILWPLLYIVSAALLGIFSMYIWTLIAKEDTNTIRTINQAAAIGLAIQVVLIIVYLIFLSLNRFQHETRSPLRLLGGDLAVTFWIGILLVGLVIPFILTTWYQFRKKQFQPSLGMAVLGFVCVVIGGIAMRSIMYELGTSIEQFL
jgi:anaerobic dimethyl sulfoxide reductase subunit C (anchor subunit)